MAVGPIPRCVRPRDREVSRIYFHSLHGETELHGSERAYLDGMCRRFASSVYAFDRVTDSHTLERAAKIMDLIPEPSAGAYGSNYMHVQFRAAQAEQARWKAANEGRTGGLATYVSIDKRPAQAFFQSFRMYLEGGMISPARFVVDGSELDFGNVSLNTALVGGSDELALAAKIHGYCEIHAFVEGKDRSWLAGIMQSGLDKGMYRRIVDNIGGVKQGWENVIDLLTSRDDEPVVMSYSVTDQFPNRHAADWVASELPSDWIPSWADDKQGLKEWNELSDDSKQEVRDEQAYEQWYSLPTEKQWELAMTNLRKVHPWLQISPETLRERTFSYPVSAYDIIHADRDARIRMACAGVAEDSD